ncbi:unnamed protein product [Rhodiola kirilowii]
MYCTCSSSSSVVSSGVVNTGNSNFDGIAVATTLNIDSKELKISVVVSGAKTQSIFDDVFSKIVADSQPIPGFRRVKGGVKSIRRKPVHLIETGLAQPGFLCKTAKPVGRHLACSALGLSRVMMTGGLGLFLDPAGRPRGRRPVRPLPPPELVVAVVPAEKGSLFGEPSSSDPEEGCCCWSRGKKEELFGRCRSRSTDRRRW